MGFEKYYIFRFESKTRNRIEELGSRLQVEGDEAVLPRELELRHVLLGGGRGPDPQALMEVPHPPDISCQDPRRSLPGRVHHCDENSQRIRSHNRQVLTREPQWTHA